jgi:hypothetical protein
LLLAGFEPLGSGKAVDGPLDREQGIDALHRLERDRGDHGGILAAPGIGRDIGQLEEQRRACAQQNTGVMAPAGREP